MGSWNCFLAGPYLSFSPSAIETELKQAMYRWQTLWAKSHTFLWANIHLSSVITWNGLLSTKVGGGPRAFYFEVLQKRFKIWDEMVASTLTKFKGTIRCSCFIQKTVPMMKTWGWFLHKTFFFVIYGQMAIKFLN